MILTGHQPAYLPWLGYFEKIMRSDVYIYVDTVQFEHRSFINRNKIKTANGPIWLTVPVLAKGHRESNLLELEINNSGDWQKKHFRSICFAYKGAPYYKEITEKIAQFYEKKYKMFTEFCFEYTLFWFQLLGIETKILRLKDLNVEGRKSELVLNMCKSINANVYISGALGRDYMDDELFERNGIKVIYQDYHPKKYPQLWGGFLPYMSILDFVMNTKDYSLIRGE